ncbi:hypothetical protein CC78DRAFT_520588 [Lojkania enalia]|uniref:Pentatricopeptide repeat-containing protein-mitochondrial domain-containing protein n=1 Tax=Lojkania enalia TaxID=147567 RepID=A0A9P4K5X8_9PLEO|nr:hypothetical protein CC78DRAFT_520588 [Didymosphaeria enalia]
MMTRPVVYDGLWRCLCPSFQPARSLRRLVQCQVTNNLSNKPPRPLRTTRSYTVTPDANSQSPVFRSGSQGPARLQNKDKLSLVHLPTTELYARLRIDAAGGRSQEVMNIVKILIKDRREKPNILLYSAILHSFVSPEDGTAGKIRRILEEMQEEGIELDATACHNILEALAVHPDYLLRAEILEFMKERWFILNDRGHNMVVAGLLRDRNFEQALEKIDSMLQQRIRVAPWLLDQAIYLLLDYDEVEEAYQLLLLRQNLGDSSISYTLWTHVLDTASRLHHVEAVNRVWDFQVVPSYLKPATGTCLNVLNIAARTGNIKLATDVFRLLVERNTTFDSLHYELLLEAHLRAKSLDAALSVILIMQESGVGVDEASLHSLYTYLNQESSRPLEVFDMLQNLENTGRKVPTAAVNVCLQASVQFGRLEEAIEIYKALHTVSRAGPNTTTFNILFQGCHKAARKELAMFLASEMIELDLKPDALTYDRLVHVCCQANDVKDAFLYYEEMRGEGHVPRRSMFEILIAAGIEKGDARTPRLLDDMKKAGFMPRKELMQAVEDRFIHPVEVSEAVQAAEDT